ncbi:MULTISPECIES: cysteine hydrolase family protein [Heyndrickxia]|jgi:nicotinamidase-related amidase|uniref:cysteine hydrolase family protein n=1 Tax=Heyndrickxia TaxID=2837504 RepID=UPI0003AABE04|nr:isochorismatase family cysteine hydrolase [Heyndrickxia oleronia]NYV68339.1 cysteine hydrolase [Bacillus sp. Gen3]MBU5210243.1 cysteine hydrolase [Heyndrickxia oleronia]MCI1592135.1 cysteine hydrolase [Heyndrickxia oleronia]MCI1615100.1 cysteine hydrolase [Heyndrickxia oleronia]MCI1763091.1 cysteine hydrolase [Heyndrickxia oleronia]
MKKALIQIDYTNDFVSEDGALTCGKPGQLIEQAIADITSTFIANNDFVVFAIDIHERNDKYHPENKLFPPHNLKGTKGRELYGKVNEIYQHNKQKNNVYWMNKTRYSAFAGTDLEIKLRERCITDLHLVGVCTDICVLHTAIDAYNKGFQLTVYEDCVASFNQLGHQWALEHFKHTLGANVI